MVLSVVVHHPLEPPPRYPETCFRYRFRDPVGPLYDDVTLSVFSRAWKLFHRKFYPTVDTRLISAVVASLELTLNSLNLRVRSVKITTVKKVVALWWKNKPSCFFHFMIRCRGSCRSKIRGGEPSGGTILVQPSPLTSALLGLSYPCMAYLCTSHSIVVNLRYTIRHVISVFFIIPRQFAED